MQTSRRRRLCQGRHEVCEKFRLNYYPWVPKFMITTRRWEKITGRSEFITRILSENHQYPVIIKKFQTTNRSSPTKNYWDQCPCRRPWRHGHCGAVHLLNSTNGPGSIIRNQDINYSHDDKFIRIVITNKKIRSIMRPVSKNVKPGIQNKGSKRVNSRSNLNRSSNCILGTLR